MEHLKTLFPHDLLRISPARYVSSPGAIKDLGTYGLEYGRRVLLLHDGDLPHSILEAVAKPLEKEEIAYKFKVFGTFSSEAAVADCEGVARAMKADFLIGLGGGRCFDTAKFVAERTKLPLITVPTSSATCAAWAALANYYDDSGVYQFGHVPPKCPDLLLLDLELSASAPPRYLAAGMIDAAAKWYESAVTRRPTEDVASATALKVAAEIKALFFEKGVEAYADSVNKKFSTAHFQMIESNILQAGLVGGLGGVKIRTAAAHALHHAMTRIRTTTPYIHGEKVAFGILAQMVMTHRPDSEIKELLKMYQKLNLPRTLEQVGLSAERPEELRIIADYACNPKSAIHKMVVKVGPEEVFRALLEVDKIGR